MKRARNDESFHYGPSHSFGPESDRFASHAHDSHTRNESVSYAESRESSRRSPLNAQWRNSNTSVDDVLEDVPPRTSTARLTAAGRSPPLAGSAAPVRASASRRLNKSAASHEVHVGNAAAVAGYEHITARYEDPLAALEYLYHYQVPDSDSDEDTKGKHKRRRRKGHN